MGNVLTCESTIAHISRAIQRKIKNKLAQCIKIFLDLKYLVDGLSTYTPVKIIHYGSLQTLSMAQNLNKSCLLQYRSSTSFLIQLPTASLFRNYLCIILRLPINFLKWMPIRHWGEGRQMARSDGFSSCGLKNSPSTYKSWPCDDPASHMHLQGVILISSLSTRCALMYIIPTDLCTSSLACLTS